MKTLDEMIAVMTAAKEGKEIERSSIAGDLILEDINWKPVDNPLWDWTSYNYRIKPEPPKPEYVPYENARDFLEAQEQHGPYIRHFDDALILPVRIDYFGDLRILFGDGTGERIDALLYCAYTWQDGTPCGKLKL